MHRLGLVDKKTMREFDVRCLTAVDKLTAKDIQKLRKREGISQAVLALCLNVTTNSPSRRNAQAAFADPAKRASNRR